MQILKKFLERNKKLNQNGFSLLELVVAVGVLLALSVGGFLAYQGINDSAKKAAVESAAATVFNAASSYSVTEGPVAGAKKAEDEYMASQGDDPKIIVKVVPNET